MKKKTIIIVSIILAVICLFIIITKTIGSNTKSEAIKSDKDTLQTKLELAEILDDRDNQIIENLGYTVSYNKTWKIPNWVAYQLTNDETYGGEERTNKFLPDPQAKGVVTSTYDYSKSGYDRGHMAPAGDMKWDELAMTESFYLSNICPQNHNLNDGDWRILEEKIRHWARIHGELYIVCGPIVTENHKTIGYNKIAVPDSFYKVVLKTTDNEIEAIGFIFKNVAGHKNLSSYVVSVDSVEQVANIDFFHALPDSVENIVESTYSLDFWGL